MWRPSDRPGCTARVPPRLTRRRLGLLFWTGLCFGVALAPWRSDSRRGPPRHKAGGLKATAAIVLGALVMLAAFVSLLTGYGPRLLLQADASTLGVHLPGATGGRGWSYFDVALCDRRAIGSSGDRRRLVAYCRVDLWPRGIRFRPRRLDSGELRISGRARLAGSSC
jgi:hypothetical protein